MIQQSSETVREVVGLFDNHDTLEKAIGELTISGFERRHISVRGSKYAMKKQLGVTEAEATTLEDNPDAPRSFDIAPEEVGVAQGVLVGGGMIVGVATATVMSGGFLVPTIVPAVIAGGVGGTVVGGVLAKLLEEKYTEFFQEQIDAGGIVLWVQASDNKHEKSAKQILSHYGAKDVHAHDIPVASL